MSDSEPVSPLGSPPHWDENDKNDDEDDGDNDLDDDSDDDSDDDDDEVVNTHPRKVNWVFHRVGWQV
jgi:hypothetical protein